MGDAVPHKRNEDWGEECVPLACPFCFFRSLLALERFAGLGKSSGRSSWDGGGKNDMDNAEGEDRVSDCVGMGGGAC